VERFLPARKAAGYRRWHSARGIAPLLEYLEAAWLAISVTPPEAQVSAGEVLAGFRDYLVAEQGLAASTVPSEGPDGSDGFGTDRAARQPCRTRSIPTRMA
jgi:hypothetical protein